ncbi:MAG: metallophosphoesterase [archaeon]
MNQKKLFEKPLIRYMKNSLLIDEKVLVLGDLHIGYEEYITRAAILPNIQLKEIFNDLNEIFERLDREKIELREIIILGDLKHEFGSILDTEWRDGIKLIDYLKGKVSLDKKTGKIVFIKGNHDTIFEPIARKRGIELKDYYKIKVNGRYVWFLHGDKLFKQLFKQPDRQTDNKTNRQMFRQTNSKKDILVLGHLHPSITLADNYKKERYKCFLYGNYKGFLVYILPSFSFVSFGYNLSKINERKSNKKAKKEFYFIINNKSLKKFNVVVYNDQENKEYNFGKLGKLI